MYTIRIIIIIIIIVVNYTNLRQNENIIKSIGCYKLVNLNNNIHYDTIHMLVCIVRFKNKIYFRIIIVIL